MATSAKIVSGPGGEKAVNEKYRLYFEDLDSVPFCFHHTTPADDLKSIIQKEKKVFDGEAKIMERRILMVGATVLLGEPRAAHLKSKGFAVRIRARNVEKEA